MANEQTTLLPQSESQFSSPSAQPLNRLWRILYVAGIIIISVVYLQWRRAVTPDVIEHDFGVGFDLTSPYGAAAISYPNGTIVNVVKIDGSPLSENDVQAIARIFKTLTVPTHFPSYNSNEDYINDIPRQVLRWVRKKIGLPASSDVREIASFLKTLRASVETYLGGCKISGAVVTIPRLPALYAEDLADSFEYTGLIYIANYPYWYGHMFTEAGAVYNANGFGLCSNYTDVVGCEKEKQDPPPWERNDEYVLSVSYTRTLLSSTFHCASMWFSRPAADEEVITNMHLGWDSRGNNPDEKYYWAEVRDAIITPVLERNKHVHREVSKVLLHGELATDEQFQRVVVDAAHALLENKTQIFAVDPVFSAARGAAEMAKRVVWSYNHKT